MSRKQSRRRALERQIARLDRRLDSLNGLSNRLSWARLGVFAAACAVGVILAAAVDVWAGGIGAAAGLAVFVILVRQHRRVQEGIRQHAQWRAIRQMHLARMAVDWSGLPPETAFSPRPDHPFEADLDLVGERSLHRLINTAVSRGGSRRLREWLAAERPDPDRIRARQAAVRELLPFTPFRDRLTLRALLASDGTGWRWESARLLDWVRVHAPARLPGAVLALLTAFAAVNVALFLLHQAGMIPPVWGLTLLVYFGIYLWQAQRLGDPFETALALRDPLDDLGSVFGYLETYRYAGRPGFRALCAPFLEGEQRSSAQLRRVTRVLAAVSLRQNPILWLILSAVAPWDLYVARALERRRAALADLLPGWLDAWFDLEALAALATFAYLNPEYAFPELVQTSPPDLLSVNGEGEQRHDSRSSLAGKRTGNGIAPIFQAEAMGHPLIPDTERVCNDFPLGRLGEIALITGSNMSGKSTFLRTLGVNLCLAQAGGPVAARGLQAAPFRLFSSMRVSDSVTDGVSYFYAEVQRLRALLSALEAADELPLFFLIDEIFRGTNNRERMIGSRAYVRALAGRGGVGAISTHDLDLTRLAGENPAIVNYHFAETILDGRMIFDYTLRPGPCPTTNALTIMRLAGLPVDTAD